MSRILPPTGRIAPFYFHFRPKRRPKADWVEFCLSVSLTHVSPLRYMLETL
jgi:hypothetical protein